MSLMRRAFLSNVYKTPTLPSNADNGADKGNSSSEENPSVHNST